MNSYTTPRRVFVALIAWVAGGLPALSQPRQIVLLYDERTEFPGLAMLDAGFARALTAGSPDRVEIYREAMDLSRFDSDAYRNLLRDYLHAKYAAKKIDVAVAVMAPALDFLLSHHDEIFPGAPIVFCGIDRQQLGGRLLPSDVTGVLLKREFSPTLKLALSLQPETKRIVVISGASQFDAQILREARKEFRPFENRLAFTYLTTLPLPELLQRLSRLPPKTVVLYLTLFRDAAGNSYIPHEVAERVSAAANAPVYGFLDQYLGRGIVGGQLYASGTQGEAGAGLVLKILQGTKPSELRLIEPVSSVVAFDWRQLQRWAIKENQLPRGSVVRFKDYSLWERHRWKIIGLSSFCVVETLLIIALVVQLRRRLRAEALRRESDERTRRSADEARESEMRFLLVANSAPILIWSSGPDKLCTFFNKGWLDFTGRALEQELGNGWTEGVHRDDYNHCLDVYESAFAVRQPFTMEYRLRRNDGEYRWVLDNGIPRFDNSGEFLGYIGSCVDISERRQAELDHQLQTMELARVGRLASMGELAASLAHEVNNPLGAMVTNASAGQRMLARGQLGTEELRELLADIISDGHRAREVIEGIRNMVRKRKAPRALVSLNEVVRDLLRLVRGDTTVRKITLVAEVDASAGMVLGDRVQLLQVLLNLTLNAFEALSVVRLEARRVVIRAEGVDDGQICVSVRDSGPGFPAGIVDQLFEPFFSTKAEGTGMGLAIARTIVETHGGTLSGKNCDDGGAIFTLCLPEATAAKSGASSLQASVGPLSL